MEVADWPRDTLTMEGETEIAKSEPVPDRATLCVAGEALSWTVSVPVCAPTFSAANLTVTVQVEPGARMPTQLPLSANPVVIAIPLMVNGTIPVFFTVTVWGAFVR